MEIKDVFGDLPTLETARLLLRKMNHDDAQDLFEYASDSEVAKYTTWSPHHARAEVAYALKKILGASLMTEAVRPPLLTPIGSVDDL
jgi:ribosomal-protein-alanine N-acetyltransferase